DRLLIWNDLSRAPTSSWMLRAVAVTGGAEQATVEGQHRRLITLISADRPRGRASIIVIRRELPRTSVAGPASGLSHRSHEDPPTREPSDRRSPCSCHLLGSGPAPLRRVTSLLAFDLDSDGPQETDELAPDGRDHFGDRLP